MLTFYNVSASHQIQPLIQLADNGAYPAKSDKEKHGVYEVRSWHEISLDVYFILQPVTFQPSNVPHFPYSTIVPQAFSVKPL